MGPSPIINNIREENLFLSATIEKRSLIDDLPTDAPHP